MTVILGDSLRDLGLAMSLVINLGAIKHQSVVLYTCTYGGYEAARREV